MSELRFCFTGLSNMHRCCVFPFALAGLFFLFLLGSVVTQFVVGSQYLCYCKLSVKCKNKRILKIAPYFAKTCTFFMNRGVLLLLLKHNLFANFQDLVS